MAKNKEKREQKKKKQRERRIVQEKLAAREKLATAQKKAQERAANEPQLPGTNRKKPTVIGSAKPSSFAANSKTPIYRRSGG